MSPQRENSGIMFNNDRKQSEKSPDLSGELNVEGKNYYISGWRRPGKNGEFISLSVKFKIAKAETPAPQQPEQDDLPF